MAFWQIFQTSADKIRAWKFSPKTSEHLEKLSEALPANVRNLLIKMVTYLYEKAMLKYGKDFVKLIITKAVEFLKNVLTGVDED